MILLSNFVIIEMGRFLLYISYIGTGFCGLARQKHGLRTIIGVLEDAMTCLKPVNDIYVVTSSRTDAGVHALCSTVHVDLVRGHDCQEYDPIYISSTLNRKLMLMDEPIRILKTLRVSDNFHSRFQTICRQYVYRVSLSKKADSWALPFPPMEHKRSYLVRDAVDMDQVYRAVDIMAGKHDFTCFTSPRNLKENPWKNTVKDVDIQVVKSEAFLEKYMLDWYPANFQNIDFIFKSHSFLYRQVRKMTSVLLAVGQGHITLEHLRKMVETPEICPEVQKKHIFSLPAFGLYLANVFYREEDLMPPCSSDGTTSNGNILENDGNDENSSHNILEETKTKS